MDSIMTHINIREGTIDDLDNRIKVNDPDVLLLDFNFKDNKIAKLFNNQICCVFYPN